MSQPDPASLQNLHDIIVGPTIPWWPLAPGWYVAFVILLLLFLWTGWRKYRQWQTNAYRRAALKRLKELGLQIQNDKSAMCKLPELLKRTALAVCPREQAAGISGQEWLEFLDLTGNTREFTQGPGRMLPDLAYGGADVFSTIQDVQIENLIRLMEQWIQNHKVITYA